MGNKLVCCRWRWIESPEFVSRPVDNNSNNNCKYSAAIENYSNGYLNQNCSADNGLVHGKSHKSSGSCQISPGCQDHQSLARPGTDGGAPGVLKPPSLAQYPYSGPYPVICPAPFYPSNNAAAAVCFQQNSVRYFHQINGTALDGSYRDSWMIKSTDQLQHISEREPEDVEHDPSINAKHPTLFLKRSKEDIENNLQRRRQENEKLVQRGLSRWSSCSTILLDDTTISQPNPALSLKALALAIYLHVRNDESSNGDDQRYRCSRDDSVYAIFDERRHPVVRTGSHSDSMRVPSHREIYRFLRGIFNMAQLTPECAIVTLVYLERLLSSAEIEILPWSWRRQVLASVLLASKVWDDQAVWNADYCQILKDLCVEDVNELERNFLELIQFNINVPSSVYAHYYFDLLQLGRNNGLYNQPSTRHSLLWDRAIRLEAVNCPPGPMDDYSPKWWTKPRPLSRFLSWESINAVASVRRVILS